MVSELVPEITGREFDGFVKQGFVFVDFWAEWCMPCVMMGPIVEEVSEKFKGRIKFGKVNINENRELSEKFDVSSIPNFILFKDGKKIAQFVGAMEADELEEKLKEFL